MLGEKIGREIRERSGEQDEEEHKHKHTPKIKSQHLNQRRHRKGGAEWRPPKHICSRLMELSYEYRHHGALF